LRCCCDSRAALRTDVRALRLRVLRLAILIARDGFKNLLRWHRINKKAPQDLHLRGFLLERLLNDDVLCGHDVLDAARHHEKDARHGRESGYALQRHGDDLHQQRQHRHG